jgi:hypothetical protein
MGALVRRRRFAAREECARLELWLPARRVGAQLQKAPRRPTLATARRNPQPRAETRNRAPKPATTAGASSPGAPPSPATTRRCSCTRSWEREATGRWALMGSFLLFFSFPSCLATWTWRPTAKGRACRSRDPAVVCELGSAQGSGARPARRSNRSTALRRAAPSPQPASPKRKPRPAPPTPGVPRLLARHHGRHQGAPRPRPRRAARQARGVVPLHRPRRSAWRDTGTATVNRLGPKLPTPITTP